MAPPSPSLAKSVLATCVSIAVNLIQSPAKKEQTAELTKLVLDTGPPSLTYGGDQL